MGEMLKNMDLDKGGRPDIEGNRLHDETGLDDLGISKTQSHRYQILAKIIEVAKEFDSRWATLECYHQLGKRILEENDNFERAKIYGKEIASRVSQSLGKEKRTIERAKIYGKDISQRVGKSLGKSRTTIDYAIQFYKNYPDFLLKSNVSKPDIE